ncbi:hypothetical protein CEP52_011854 [Fusarium oligoseptatum]|uniref:Nephrocystin 3-like N-terminal domain-containing protein n=1 Tax=Fusarium oligoseptatum TaxID=2604345 RepID=A0A428T1A8_9HYPO|nr:hypothetical protein CEP52_011854 [Fusarium oligoseptatum]
MKGDLLPFGLSKIVTRPEGLDPFTALAVGATVVQFLDQQLISAVSECHKLSAKIDQIADRFLVERDSEGDHKACLPLFCRREPKFAPWVSSVEVQKIEKQRDVIRSQAIGSILLCLWEDCKRTKKWEVHLGTQLNTVGGLLEHIGKQTIYLTDETRLPEGDNSGLVAAILDGLQNDVRISVDRVKFRDAVLLLIEVGRSVSLVELGKDITMALGTGKRIPQVIRNELVEVIWRKDWEMDMSIPGVSATGTLPNLDTATVAQGIGTSARFYGTNTREEAISKLFGDTYGWILYSKPPEQDGKPLWGSFLEWLAEDSNTIYWITGKPGSGKSTMMKFLLQHPFLREHLSSWLGSLRLLIVRYYAWNGESSLHQSFEGLKRTIISQALDLYPELTLKLAPRRCFLCQLLKTTSSLPHWETWEVEEAFIALLSECGKTIKLALFTDGLDEFDMLPKDVVHQIREMIALCPTGLKVCVASRTYSAFSDEYGQGPVLEMHLVTHNDMINFVAGSFENNAFTEHLALDPESTSQLISEIVTKANGIFQWVSLVVPLLLDYLTDGESPAQPIDIQQVLQDLPSDLDILYDMIWARVQPENLPMGSSMMQVAKAVEGPVSFLTMLLVVWWKPSSTRVAPYSDDHAQRRVPHGQTLTRNCEMQ